MSHTYHTLYSITDEYDKTVSPLDIAYGNGFEKKGKAYFKYLGEIRPDFKEWALTHYPDCAEYL
jgi:hypothetical protein